MKLEGYLFDIPIYSHPSIPCCGMWLLTKQTAEDLAQFCDSMDFWVDFEPAKLHPDLFSRRKR